jgi:hypothetical protein
VNRDGRPPSVRRYLRRPLWWTGFALVLVGALTALVLADARRGDAALARGPRAEGTVGDAYRGGSEVPVSYDNPVTGERVRTTTYVWDASLFPDGGQRVPLEVHPDDPDTVRIAGDRFPLTANLPADAALVAVPLIAWAVRRWSLGRTEGLVAAPAPSFAMLAAVAPSGRFGRRLQLHLYPLDAAAGAPSLCAVPLLDTAGAPIGGPAFTVEVKGSPRPRGRVVARAGEAVLWPSGRGLMAGSLPRPPEVGEPVPLPPARTVPLPIVPELAWRHAAGAHLVALAGLLALLVAVTVATTANSRRAERIERHGARVVAQVTGVDDDAGVLLVSYRLRGDERDRTGRASVDFPTEYDVGRRYPARVDPRLPTQLRLAKEPYDAVEPVAWASAPVLVAAALTLRHRRWWRRSHRLAAEGPWHRAVAWSLPSENVRDVVALGPPGARQARCTLRVARAEGRPWMSPAQPGPVQVAGDPRPGELVAVWQGDRLLAVVGPAGASHHLRWSSPGPGRPPWRRWS